MSISFWLNDALVEVEDLPPTTTLLRYLRDHYGMMGTKEGCGEGDCGACTVAVLEDDGGGPTWRAVNSCLMFLPMVHGKRVMTVEGLADGDALHPAQQAMVQHRGSQCGYCTPGIVMSLFEGTYRQDIVSTALADDQVAGNLCRCTGYRPIRDASRQVAGLRPEDRFLDALSQPLERDLSLSYQARGAIYLQPATLAALWEARAAHPGARLVAGGTDVGLEVSKLHREFPAVIGLEALEVLRTLTVDEAGWTVGAGVRITRLAEVVGAALPALQKLLLVFGSRQIRSRGTLGGNLCNASPIGDLAPLLIVLGATAVIAGPDGEREVPLGDFFEGYRQTALRGIEILSRVVIPRPPAGVLVASYKVSRRRELDISAVSAGMWLELDEGGLVRATRLSWGGMAATPVRTPLAEAALIGRPWTRALVEQVADGLSEELHPISDHRASADYRAQVARNLLLGFYLESQEPPAPDARPTATVLC
ncbi:MAG: xanthine dehydrogenase small subunit [Deltaproteobacteria bacterium]|nr:xanthine dehydrogenase small subunit [Deltaproteobacteria bacterium]